MTACSLSLHGQSLVASAKPVSVVELSLDNLLVVKSRYLFANYAFLLRGITACIVLIPAVTAVISLILIPAVLYRSCSHAKV